MLLLLHILVAKYNKEISQNIIIEHANKILNFSSGALLVLAKKTNHLTFFLLKTLIVPQKYVTRSQVYTDF